MLYLFIKLPTGFGHTDHHQAKIQKRKVFKMLKCSCTLVFFLVLWDPIYLFFMIHSNTVSLVLKAAGIYLRLNI
jgi:hypothetical protein